MKTLARRQTILENLFDRSPSEPSKVNYANVIRDFNAREVIKADPYVYQLWQSRMAIVRDEPGVKVPPNTVDFFEAYADGIKSPSMILPDETFEYGAPWVEAAGHTCVMYSGGAESVFMEATFSYVPLIRVHNFFPNTSIGREFQLGLIGMALGYSMTLIGCGFLNEAKVRRDFEYTQDFVDLWNVHFHPSHLQYPVGRLPTKDQIIDYLARDNLPFISCETLQNGKECGKCWHCAEKYFSIMALKTRPDGEALVLEPEMDLDFLKRLQRQNQFNMRQEIDRFAITTDFFKMLERKYGVTSWYKGDPTKPFG